MNKTIELASALENKKNGVVLKNFPELQWDDYKKGTTKVNVRDMDFEHVLSTRCCCHNTGWSGKDPGTLEDWNKALLDCAANLNTAIKIKLKYDNVDNMKRGWEMHLVRQERIRMERFDDIVQKVFDTVESALKNVNLDKYVEEHFDILVADLEVKPKAAKLEVLGSEDAVFAELSKNTITPQEAKRLIEVIKEKNADKLCQFSGSGRDADTPKRICSRTGDPKRRGDCSTCRVAADWEEAYG